MIDSAEQMSEALLSEHKVIQSNGIVKQESIDGDGNSIFIRVAGIAAKETTDHGRAAYIDIDVFEQLMAQKEKALGEINILDKGFDSVYHKVSPYLEQDKQSYRSAILEMQNLIRVITDCGVKIEGLERRNREVFQRYLLKQRQEIGNSRASSRTAVSYYQNMPNQHHAWQSYFLDKKK